MILRQSASNAEARPHALPVLACTALSDITAMSSPAACGVPTFLNIDGTGWFTSRFWSTRPLTGRRVTGSRLGLSNARKRLKGRPLTDSHSSQPRHIQGVGRFALPLPSSTVLLVIQEGDRSMQVQGFWGSSRRNTDAFVHRTASQSRGAIRWRAALAGLGFFFHLMRRRAAECV